MVIGKEKLYPDSILTPVRAKHSGDQFSIFPQYFCPNASPLRLLINS
ncbi:hypothetical protein H5968_23285 [Sphaerospermopsis sp. LEGE 00249]|nr:hypothetical protein [Sphaerospermopsis sp. LEGE 00249]